MSLERSRQQKTERVDCDTSIQKNNDENDRRENFEAGVGYQCKPDTHRKGGE